MVGRLCDMVYPKFLTNEIYDLVFVVIHIQVLLYVSEAYRSYEKNLHLDASAHSHYSLEAISLLWRTP